VILTEEGHLQMSDGKTTRPVKVGEVPAFYVGSSLQFIAFDYLIIDEERVALHSELHDPDTDTHEDFIYEVAERHEALTALRDMLEDALEYLEEQGYVIDYNLTPNLLIARMTQELGAGLH